jgi:hypothetical protein
LDRLRDLVIGRELCPLLAQPGFQLGDERPAALLANADALGRRDAVDLPLDGQQGVDAMDRFDRDRRLVEPRQIEKLAPRMRPPGLRPAG